jgi:hypothetical protein
MEGQGQRLSMMVLYKYTLSALKKRKRVLSI